MKLDVDRLVTLTQTGARVGGYQLDEESLVRLRARVRVSLGQFGGEGAEVDEELGQRIDGAFIELGHTLAEEVGGPEAAQRDPGTAAYAETISADEFAAFLEKLCPGFWPIC